MRTVADGDAQVAPGSGVSPTPIGIRRDLRCVERQRLGRWRAEWDAMVDVSPSQSPFSRSWWLSAVAVHEPLFVLILDGRELIGGLALERRDAFGVTVLRMMGSGPLCPDHLDLLAAHGREDDVREAVRAWISRGPSVVLAEGLIEGALLSSVLPPPVDERRVSVAPYTDLDEPFLSRCSRNLRSNIRKAERRMRAHGVSYRHVPPAGADMALRDLRALHRRQRGRGSHFLGAFDRFAAAARSGVDAGEVSFHELALAGRPIASVVCLEVARRVSFYQGARIIDHDLRGAGTLLLHHAIEDAQARGFDEVDFLRGDEPYKAAFATRERGLFSAEASTGVRGRALLGTIRGYRRSRAVASRLRRRHSLR
jgi:CelD/BcsL family acetyltransferase involved in cellulose biosynthesis